MVLIEFSANDFFRKNPKEATENNLKEIVRQVQNMGAIAVLVDTGGAYPMEPYTKIQKQIAKEYNTLFVPGIMDGIYNKKALKSDQIHPNNKGYEIVAKHIKKVIKPYL
jgi:lysophospholipase L1-like esterase